MFLGGFSAAGMGEKPTTIARSLRLSIKTISTYRSRILEKLHLKANSHLVHYALQRDLVSGLSESENTSSIYRKSAVS